MHKFSFYLSVTSLFFAIVATRSFAPVSFFELSSPSALSEPLNSLELSLDSAENPADTFQSSRPVAATPKTVYFSGVERVSDTRIDAGSGIKIFDNMFYAHSTEAFSNLRFINVNDTIIATVDGEIETLRIVNRAVYTLDYLNQNKYFFYRIYKATGHAYTFMTCGDGSATSNDGNYRLVLFADRV